MDKTVTLKLEGMSCNHCAMTIRKSLENVDGVINAIVDFNKNLAHIKTNDTTKTESLISAVKNAGYHATVE